MSYKITLANGTIIDNLSLNGNNFVSKTELTAADFDGKLAHVTITGPNDGDVCVGEHGTMMLAEDRVQVWPDGYYFVLLDIPESTLREIEVDSRLDYIEMMEGL